MQIYLKITYFQLNYFLTKNHFFQHSPEIKDFAKGIMLKTSTITEKISLNSGRKAIQERILSTIKMKRDSTAKYVVSYGGGINSTAMIVYLVKNKFPLDYVVFSDTGNEMPETYEYLKIIQKYLMKKRIPFKIVKVRNNTSLSDRCLKRKVIPSQIWRWCTRDMKVTPIHAFYRKLHAHIYQYMGIDYDEVHRMKPAKVDYVTNLYPLIDYKIGREECVNLIKKARLPIPIKSGCYMCPFNNMDRWAEIHKNHPDLYRHAIKIEENSKHFGKQSLAPKGYTLRQLGKILKKNKKLPMVDVDSPCGSECMI